MCLDVEVAHDWGGRVGEGGKDTLDAWEIANTCIDGHLFLEGGEMVRGLRYIRR